ncbi:MAG TPA: DUF1501 domain-containing protein, partial [Gemmatales bacterium]|nr:DUF1501 domain-containing protein [Gemmatales bacterium]
YPGTPLAQKLRNIAHLIDAGLTTRVYYVSIDGFDTHSDQAGNHTRLLGELSSSLTAFYKDLKSRGHHKRVLILTFPEFGRRVKENGSLGTDHGAAAPVFLIGGKVQPGLIGMHPRLDQLDDGNLKHHTDFRSIYSTILDQWLGISSKVILQKHYNSLPILKV